jgi:hypothetical protein
MVLIPSMKSSTATFLTILFLASSPEAADAASARKTELSIQGEDFFINGQPTYARRIWKEQRIEGLLLNSRMVQGTFDDRNPETSNRWAYPDTGRWDAERNTREFLAAMPSGAGTACWLSP